jgi:predicted HD superfamily hydrolase involved in NAD metabolism
MPQANERLNTLAEDLQNDNNMTQVKTKDNAPFAAQVFKTVIDPYSGKLSYLKSFRGVLKSGSVVWNANTECEERIGQVYLLRGKKMEPVDELVAGDIGAVNKLGNTNTGDTLCDPSAKVRFTPIYFPKPNLFMAVTAEKKGEEDKVFAGLAKLKEEDYTFSVEKNAETGEILLGGQGDIQLEILAKKVKMRYGVDMTKAAVAGLLHDSAKNYTDDELFALCDKYNIPLSEDDRKAPPIIHSYVGAFLAKEEYGIKDSEILDAIYNHSTGCENMSLLSKIIFVADMTEPGRKDFPGLSEIRALMYEDIDKALVASMDANISYTKMKGAFLHPGTLKARDFVLAKGKN